MHRTKFAAQVGIIGASIAGSACAIELAKKGISVLVLDRHRFPRRKACGEGLSHLAAPLLRQLGISDDLVTDEGAKLFGYHFASPRACGVRTATCRVDSQRIRGWGISRRTLDSALVSKLRQLPEATVVTEETVRSLLRADRSWELVTQSSRVATQFIVVASGANPQAICRSFIKETHSATPRVGLTSYGVLKSDAPLKVVTLIPFRDGEIYITPLAGAAINVSVVGCPDFVQSCRDPLDLEKIISDSTKLTLTLEATSLGAGHFGARHQSLDPHLYLVGDAYESFDPLCGMGMTHALASGIQAAHAIASVEGDAVNPHKAKARYDREHKRLAAQIRRSSFAIRTFVSSYERFPRTLTLAHRLLGARGLAVLDRLGPRLEG